MVTWAIAVIIYAVVGFISFICYSVANEGKGTWKPDEAVACLLAWPVVVTLHTVYGLSGIWYKQAKKLGERR